MCRSASFCLSFDDGPGPSTAALLDVLRAADHRAMFFVLGQNLARRLGVAVRIVQEGHTLGNHSDTHARPGDITEQVFREEIEATDRLIRQAYAAAGRPAPASIPVRLPYGIAVDDPRIKVLNALGRPHIGWTLILDDWLPTTTAERLEHSMREHITQSCVLGDDVLICLHDSSRHGDTREATVEAVRRLLASQTTR